MPAQVNYFTGGKDVGPVEYGMVRYHLGSEDMFAIMARSASDDPTLHITSVNTHRAMADFRDILIDKDVVGHELPL